MCGHSSRGGSLQPQICLTAVGGAAVVPLRSVLFQSLVTGPAVLGHRLQQKLLNCATLRLCLRGRRQHVEEGRHSNILSESLSVERVSFSKSHFCRDLLDTRIGRCWQFGRGQGGWMDIIMWSLHIT